MFFNRFQKIVLRLMRLRLNPRNVVNRDLFKQPFSIGQGAVIGLGAVLIPESLLPETVRWIKPGQWWRLAASAAAMG
jgi:hypothetical protein